MYFYRTEMCITFFVNLSVLISTYAADIARIYERTLLNVTRPDPIGYLFLSVSIPANKKSLSDF